MQFRSAVLRSLILVTALALSTQHLAAQGIFEGFGFPKTVIATGQTEVAGSVHVALRLGTVIADTLVINVSPFRITNANASDIRLTLGGNITTGAVTLDSDNSIVRVAVTGGPSFS